MVKDQIISDGRTVWINSGTTGVAIGRFSKMGIDVHNTDGDGCFHCVPGPCGQAEWDRFVFSMKEYHGVVVHERFKPEYLNG